MPLITCKTCQGTRKISVIRSAIRGNGHKVITGHSSEPCSTCKGEGVVRVKAQIKRYYMRHNFTDGSAAAMANAGEPWQVLAGLHGKSPKAGETCEAKSFTVQQNALRAQNILRTTGLSINAAGVRP